MPIRHCFGYCQKPSDIKHAWPCPQFVPEFKVGDRVLVKPMIAFYGGIKGTIVVEGGGDSWYVMQPEEIMHNKKCTSTNLFHGFELQKIEPCEGCLNQTIDSEEAWLTHFKEAHNGPEEQTNLRQ